MDPIIDFIVANVKDLQFTADRPIKLFKHEIFELTVYSALSSSLDPKLEELLKIIEQVLGYNPVAAGRFEVVMINIYNHKIVIKKNQGQLKQQKNDWLFEYIKLALA